MFIHDILQSQDHEWKSHHSLEDTRKVRRDMAYDVYMFFTPEYRTDDFDRWILDKDDNVIDD